MVIYIYISYIYSIYIHQLKAGRVRRQADAGKIRKLFTACSGPVGPVPREVWQQRDPTWRITDERNAVGMVVRTQGGIPERGKKLGQMWDKCDGKIYGFGMFWDVSVCFGCVS